MILTVLPGYLKQALFALFSSFCSFVLCAKPLISTNEALVLTVQSVTSSVDSAYISIWFSLIFAVFFRTEQKIPSVSLSPTWTVQNWSPTLVRRVQSLFMCFLLKDIEDYKKLCYASSLLLKLKIIHWVWTWFFSLYASAKWHIWGLVAKCW